MPLRHRHADRRGAHRLDHTPEEIRDLVGADSLGYLSLEGLFESVNGPEGEGKGKNGFCDACFSSNYPINIQQPARLRQLRLVT